MKSKNSKKMEPEDNFFEKPCAHLYMKAGKQPGEKLCISCGRTIYISRILLGYSSILKKA